MAELADALDLGSSGETRTGSIPARRTKTQKIPLLSEFFYYILVKEAIKYDSIKS